MAGGTQVVDNGPGPVRPSNDRGATEAKEAPVNWPAQQAVTPQSREFADEMKLAVNAFVTLCSKRQQYHSGDLMQQLETTIRAFDRIVERDKTLARALQPGLSERAAASLQEVRMWLQSFSSEGELKSVSVAHMKRGTGLFIDFLKEVPETLRSGHRVLDWDQMHEYIERAKCGRVDVDLRAISPDKSGTNIIIRNFVDLPATPHASGGNMSISVAPWSIGDRDAGERLVAEPTSHYINLKGFLVPRFLRRRLWASQEFELKTPDRAQAVSLAEKLREGLENQDVTVKSATSLMKRICEGACVPMVLSKGCRELTAWDWFKIRHSEAGD